MYAILLQRALIYAELWAYSKIALVVISGISDVISVTVN